MTSFIVSKIDFICCLNKKVLRNFGQLIVQTRQTSKRHLIDKYIQILNILEIRLYEVVTSPFKHFHSALFPLKPWLFATVVFVAHFRNTHSFVLEMWKWNERRGCLVRLVIFSSYRALFCSPGSLGESLIFSFSSWVPAAVYFETVILSRPQSSSQVQCQPHHEKESEREGGKEVTGLKDFHPHCLYSGE